MRLTLATLPLHAVDLDGRLTLRHGSDDAPGTRVAVLGLDADALLAAAPHLGAELTLTLCDGAPAPGPSRDELAARLAEAERELAYVTRQRDAADSAHTALSRWAQRVVSDIGALAAGKPLGPRAPEYGHSLADDLRALATRVDREPPQRAAGLGAGVAAAIANLIDAEVSHADFVANCSENPAVARAASEFASRLRRLAALVRQDVRSADRGAEAVEPRERVGGAVERGAAVVIDGLLWDAGSCSLWVTTDGGATQTTLANRLRELGVLPGDGPFPVETRDGRQPRVRVRLRAERLGEGGSVHGESVSPAATTREAHS